MKMTDDAYSKLMDFISIQTKKAYMDGQTDITDLKEMICLNSAECFLEYKIAYWAGELTQQEIDIWEKVGGWSWGPQTKFESWEKFGFK